MMPAIDSIEVGRNCNTVQAVERIRGIDGSAHAQSTGQAVDFMATARPAMMLVPWPVVDACAT